LRTLIRVAGVCRSSATLNPVVWHRPELTLYHMLQAALLRPPAIKASEDVARFLRSEPHSTSTSVSYPVADFVKQAQHRSRSAVLVGDQLECWLGRRRLRTNEGSFVSTNWFDELGYGPVRGRLLNDRARWKHCLAVGGLELHLSGSRGSVAIRMSLARRCTSIENPVTVVGVAPKGASRPGFRCA
jgi:hypothetical protein